MKNTIYLRRKNKVIVGQGSNNLDPEYILAIQKNIDSLGYTLSTPLAVRLSTLSIDEITKFHHGLVKSLKKMSGSHRKFNPMYPNFPQQVKDLPLETLFCVNAMHYLGDWIGLRILPRFEKEDRPPLDESSKPKVITLGSEEDFNDIFTNLMSSKSSLSNTDKTDLAWFIQKSNILTNDFFPESIPHKENLVFVAKELLNKDFSAAILISKSIKTATDILRLATGLSDGDISLATNTRFKSFKRKERRFLLHLFDNTNGTLEDMVRHRGKWLRLGERLHPGEYKSKYVTAYKAFLSLRNDKKFKTFNSEVEALLGSNNAIGAAELLQKRPGDFARRLDHLLRMSSLPMNVLSLFGAVAHKVSGPVLIQLVNHFKNRNDEKEFRVVFAKGSIAKATALENNLPPLPKNLCSRVVDVVEKALLYQYAHLSQLGKVYVDESLKNSVVPLQQRAASNSLRPLTRGTRIPIPEGNTLRFFLWWRNLKSKNGPRRVDLDLSGVVLNDNWEHVSHVSYTNLKDEGIKCYHSGDITSAPKGACEFIDFDIPSIIKGGGRYVVMNVYSFTGQNFNTIPECFGGWMSRKNLGSGEIFEPKTIQDKIDITSESKTVIPVIFDLITREAVWMDLAPPTNLYANINIESNYKTMKLLGKSMVEAKLPNLYDLFILHAKARGEIVSDREDADVVFAYDGDVTPFDIEKITSEFL